MGLNTEAMEGGPRLAQVRKTKKYLMIAQVIVVFVAVIILTIVDGQIQMKPFYYNISSFLYFVILIALIIGIENMIFRVLEVRYNKSSSAKYFMLKRSMRRSLVVIAVAAVVLAIAISPLLGVLVAGVYDEGGETSTMITFNNRDALGLTTVDSIHVSSNGNAEVIVVTEENYNAYKGNLEGLRQHATVYTEDTIQGIDMDFPHALFGTYYLIVNGDSGVTVTYTIHKAVAPYFAGIISTFAIMFVIAYVAWTAYVMPVSKQYAKSAIYR